MRIPLSKALIALVLACGACAAQAQEATKIVGQYVKAAGGGKALGKIQTLAIEGTFSSDDGKSGTYTFDTKLPNRYYSELLVGEQNLIEAYNGKSAWHQNPAAGIGTLVGDEGMQLEAAAQFYNSRLLNLKKNKIAVTSAGNAQVRGKDAVQLEITTATGIKRQVFFDPQSHLIVKESATVGGVEEEILYDDYRTVDGVKIAHKIELHRGSEKYGIDVTRAVINGTVGERVFDFPMKSQVKLPDLKALFKEIDDNQKAIDKLKENYAGTRVEEETEFEGDGRVKKRENTEYTFFYLNGEEVSTLVKKEGKPLGAEEQKKENEKTQKRIEGLQKREAKKEAKEEKAKEEGKNDDKDEPGIEVFLRACQFVNPRHERFRGQDVLVFDFEPNPEFKPHKLVEKIVQKLAGVIWIDERAHDVARLEAYFVGDIKIAGGLLANLQKGTSFVFEQAYINNEVWLPTYEEAHVGVRVLLVKGFKVNAVTRYSDYKKFNVETLSTIAKPKGAADTPADPPAKPQ
jgi:outer membrane lipoprotein-sorting protein